MTSRSGGRELVSIESIYNERSEILRADVRMKWATMTREIRMIRRRKAFNLNFCQEKENDFEFAPKSAVLSSSTIRFKIIIYSEMYMNCLHLIKSGVEFKNKEYTLMSTKYILWKKEVHQSSQRLIATSDSRALFTRRNKRPFLQWPHDFRKIV